MQIDLPSVSSLSAVASCSESGQKRFSAWLNKVSFSGRSNTADNSPSLFPWTLSLRAFLFGIGRSISDRLKED